jgi:hypothetical protein
MLSKIVETGRPAAPPYGYSYTRACINSKGLSFFLMSVSIALQPSRLFVQHNDLSHALNIL